MRAGQVPTHSPGERRKIRGPDRGLRFAHDSLLEQAGFELVWGFSCQVVVFGL
jgi:hypothetical protein